MYTTIIASHLANNLLVPIQCISLFAELLSDYHILFLPAKSINETK